MVRISPARLGTLLVAATVLASAPDRAAAQLVVGDFLAPGDELLITDMTTNIQWLTPFHTRGETFNSPFVQALMVTHGFTYATGAQVTDMINSNFGNPPVGAPGTAAGYAAAGSFLSIFGINWDPTCNPIDGPIYACPRTQGRTADPGPDPDTHLAFGMVQADGTGWMIADNPWSDASTSIQLGSWLVRGPGVTTVPEPASLLLLATGLVGVAGVAARRRKEGLNES